MTKNSKRKLLFTIVILTLLLISSAYATLIPDGEAAEITARQKGLSALSSVVGVDLAKYSVTTEENSQNPTYLGGILQENVLYNLTSANSKLRAFCTFANGHLQGIYVLENEGTLSLTKPVVSVDAVESAQDFLGSYQTYTGKPVFGELKATLNNVDASKNLTKTSGDNVLQVSVYDNITHFKWYYTANGAIAPYSKVVSMGFKDGLLTSFIDNWNLYSIGSTSVNLSKEEAVAIALDTAREHSWTMQLDEDTLDPSNFNEKRSVSWTALVFDGSLDADKTRSEDVLELYPVWRVGLVLNRVYGELYGLEVDIWADTKEVRSVNEEYSPLVSRLFENNTGNVGESVPLFNGVEPSFVMGIMASATIVVLMGIFAAMLLKKKNPKTLCPRKPSFLKTCGILLGFLLLSMIFLPLVATANATTRAGNVWGSRSSGATNNPNSNSWRKTDDELLQQANASSYIASNCFSSTNGYTGYNNDGADKDDILYQADYFTDNYDYVAIVDFDHGVGNILSPGEFHYMFEDDVGTRVGYPWDFDEVLGNGVYDKDIYDVFPPAKVHFAFIDACMSARISSTAVVPGYPLVEGGGFNANGTVEGLPFAFTHRRVICVPTGYSGTFMSDDGYNYPDAFPQCYIGFPFGSASLDQKIDEDGGYLGTGPKWYIWIWNFFYEALNFDISVKQALNIASAAQWTCDGFYDSPLTGDGFTAAWPMDYDGDGDFNETIETGVHSTLAVYGNSNIHLKNFQPADYVTAPSVSGPTSGDVDVSYEFKARAIDSHGDDIRYVIDWGDGSEYTQTGYNSNGDLVNASHSYSSAGQFSIKVKAQCENGVWSSWSSPHSMQIGDYWLYVEGHCDGFGGVVDPYVWIDGDGIGQAPVCVFVEEGWHTVTVDYQWGYWRLLGFSDGYGNGASRPIYSDTDITAYYGW